MNHPRIVSVKPLSAFRIELTFTDGVRGEVDLHDDIVGVGGVFRALESPDFFRQVQVDAEAGTIVWPNHVDLCPDVLYDRVAQRPLKKHAQFHV